MRDAPAGVIEEISPNDRSSKVEPDLDAYLALGKAALDCVRIAMLTAEKPAVGTILDLPCGHGLVTRMLKAEFPEARLACCDIDHGGVEFCAETFGAVALYGRAPPTAAMLEGLQFDLIWCGSLFARLDVRMWKRFLDLFEGALVPGGLIVFTTYGRAVAARLSDPENGPLQMPADHEREALLRHYEAGFAYADHDISEEAHASSPPTTYGTLLAKPSWVCRQVQRRPSLRLLNYSESRWRLQDVVACLKVHSVMPEP